jgi:hypothetical protein
MPGRDLPPAFDAILAVLSRTPAIRMTTCRIEIGIASLL